VVIYFNRHLRFFFGRQARIGLRQTAAGVPLHAYWVTRRGQAADFETVLEMPPPAPPRIMAVATALSRTMRLGSPGPEPILDAGAPALVPASWFVLRRTERPAAAPRP
jgi:hypothetical protein